MQSKQRPALALPPHGVAALAPGFKRRRHAYKKEIDAERTPQFGLVAEDVNSCISITFSASS
jgi:hypothetical protein